MCLSDQEAWLDNVSHSHGSGFAYNWKNNKKKVSKVETEKILKQSRKDILRRLQNEISIKIQYIIVSNKMNET